MSLAGYRTSHSYKKAVELGPHLVSLAEELPAAEEMGLSWQLRKLMIELPAAVAQDTLSDTVLRRPAAIQLVTVLELIDRIYPALDTADIRRQAEELAEELLDGDDSSAPVEKPALPERAPAPARIPVIPEVTTPPAADEAPAEEAPEPTHVAVEATHVAVQPASPDEESQPSDVHPDSV